MYNYKSPTKTTIVLPNKQYYNGQSMEEKIRRILNNDEPIDAISERLYTERKDGVPAEYNIRSDRWDIALDGFDYITKTNLAKREERMKTMGEQAKEGMNKEGGESGGPASTAGTNDPK